MVATRLDTCIFLKLGTHMIHYIVPSRHLMYCSSSILQHLPHCVAAAANHSARVPIACIVPDLVWLHPQDDLGNWIWKTMSRFAQLHARISRKSDTHTHICEYALDLPCYATSCLTKRCITRLINTKLQHFRFEKLGGGQHHSQSSPHPMHSCN